MSTTQQEPLVAPIEQTEPPETEKEKASSSREYVILEQTRKGGPWEELRRVTATDVDGALNSLGTDLKQTSKYVAVAERYWRPATPTVDTVTTVTLQFD